MRARAVFKSGTGSTTWSRLRGSNLLMSAGLPDWLPVGKLACCMPQKLITTLPFASPL